MGNIIKMITDFISGKSQEFVDYVLGLFGSFSQIIQALILVVSAILVLIGTIAVIKKSAKLIIVVAALMVIGFIIWTFV